MDVLRTPDHRFDNLADYSFAPHYTPIRHVDGTELRMHHVDEGPASAPPTLLLHGEPSWSYLYRHVIPTLAAQGHRVLAPDLIGFGRSDKPGARADYTYEHHVAWLTAWLRANELSRITLFCQDWGGLLGLRLVAAFPQLFAAVVASNTMLPIGRPAGEGFQRWLQYSQSLQAMNAGAIVKGGCNRGLTEAEIAAYNAPYPDGSFQAGALQFPMLVPITPEHPSVAENLAAWKVLETFQKPFVTAFSDNDPVTTGGDQYLQARIPGCRGQPHCTLKGGHFVQEDSPAEIAALLAKIASP